MCIGICKCFVCTSIFFFHVILFVQLIKRLLFYDDEIIPVGQRNIYNSFDFYFLCNEK